MARANNPINRITKDHAYPAGSYRVVTNACFSLTVSKVTTGRVHVLADRNDVYTGPKFFDSWKTAFSHIRAEAKSRRAIASKCARANAIKRARKTAETKRAESKRRADMTPEARIAEDISTADLLSTFFGV